MKPSLEVTQLLPQLQALQLPLQSQLMAATQPSLQPHHTQQCLPWATSQPRHTRQCLHPYSLLRHTQQCLLWAMSHHTQQCLPRRSPLWAPHHTLFWEPRHTRQCLPMSHHTQRSQPRLTQQCLLQPRHSRPRLPSAVLRLWLLLAVLKPWRPSCLQSAARRTLWSALPTLLTALLCQLLPQP